jgi:hypothetical protein
MAETGFQQSRLRFTSRGYRSAKPIVPIKPCYLAFDPGAKNLDRMPVPLALWIYQVVRATRRQSERDRDHQPAGTQVVVGEQVGGEQYSHALGGGVERVVRAIEMEPSA